MTLWCSIKSNAVVCIHAWNRIVLVLLCLGFVPPTWCRADTPARVLFPFQGKIDFRQKQFSLLMDMGNTGSLSIAVTQDAQDTNHFHLSVNINHLKTPIFDIASILECPLEVVQNADGQWHLSGKVWSKYTLINYQPVQELSGNFEMRNNTLSIDSLVIGELAVQGSVQFVKPYLINLALNLAEIDVADFLEFWAKENPRLASGRLLGKIALSGPWDRLQVKGNFMAYNSIIKGSALENLAVNFEGIYPVMTLVNSTGNKENGLTFNITGDVDLSDRANFIPQIRALSKQAIVQKEGENLEWTLKRVKSEEHGNSTTELKYLKKQGTETGSAPDENDMLGVERSIQF